MLNIENAVAVITGAGSGIGESFAKYWVQKGGRAVIADIVPESLARVEKELAVLGGDVASVVCDVTKEEDTQRLACLAIERFGGIHLVLPAAGIIKDGLLLSPDRETGKVTKKMSLQQFQAVLDINLTGVFLTVRECAEQMINSGSKGLICLISSTAGCDWAPGADPGAPFPGLCGSIRTDFREGDHNPGRSPFV